ncbi:hypothetical protein ABIB25_003864 [Nakamurella sp. UYEF19]
MANNVETTEVFLALWLDEDMLRAEFDAIIAAEWPTRVPTRMAQNRCQRPNSGPSHRWIPARSRPLVGSEPAPARDPGQERSPPRGTGW